MSVDSATLTPSYCTHWGLQRAPFASGVKPAFFHETPSNLEVEARLRFLTGGTRQAGLLLGERGTGKTLLTRRFAQALRSQNRLVGLVDAAGLTAMELLWQAASAFAIGPRPSENTVELFRRMADFALTRPQSLPAILVVDNADQAGPDLQTQLVRLLRIPTANHWLGLVMVAETREASRLQEGLLETVDLRIDLDAWTEQETVGYLQMALFEAGCDRPAFDAEALGAIHALAEGIPRRVNRLAEQALTRGAAAQVEQVPAEIVEAAFASLSFVAAS